MNRREFFSRASLAVAGIAAACGMLPELAKAEENHVAWLDKDSRVSNSIADADLFGNYPEVDFGITHPWPLAALTPNRTNFAYWRGLTEAE